MTICAKRLKLKVTEWKNYLERICQKVDKIADTIDKHHKNANTAKQIGSSHIAQQQLQQVLEQLGGRVAASPIGAFIAIVSGVVAIARSLTSIGVMVASHSLQSSNKSEVQKVFEKGKELRSHVGCMRELQRSSAKFEEMLSLILQLSGKSLQSQKKTALSSLQQLLDWAWNLQILDWAWNLRMLDRASDSHFQMPIKLLGTNFGITLQTLQQSGTCFLIWIHMHVWLELALTLLAPYCMPVDIDVNQCLQGVKI